MGWPPQRPTQGHRTHRGHRGYKTQTWGHIKTHGTTETRNHKDTKGGTQRQTQPEKQRGAGGPHLNGPGWLPPPQHQALDLQAGCAEVALGSCHSPAAPSGEPRGRASRKQMGAFPEEGAADLGLNFALGVPVIDVAAHGSSVDSCRDRWDGDREGWGGAPTYLTFLVTLTLGSKEYSVARLVAVGLAIVLGVDRMGGGEGVRQGPQTPLSPLPLLASSLSRCLPPSESPQAPKAVTKSTHLVVGGRQLGATEQA